jgi:predicted GTPase
MMIMGIPNVGKSTLMNVLSSARLAKVGDEPAVTRAQQTSQTRCSAFDDRYAGAAVAEDRVPRATA